MLTATTPEIAGHRIVSHVSTLTAFGAASGKRAADKANEAYRSAIQNLLEAAEDLGANALVGLRTELIGASAGGTLGDAVIALVQATAVVVEPQ